MDPQTAQVLADAAVVGILIYVIGGILGAALIMGILLYLFRK